VKAAAENFKGISYVRISSLSTEQQSTIKLSFNSRQLIKILRDGVVLDDCLQYEHYTAWYEKFHLMKTVEERPLQLELQNRNLAIAS
jgi:hypothetical protein